MPNSRRQDKSRPQKEKKREIIVRWLPWVSFLKMTRRRNEPDLTYPPLAIDLQVNAEVLFI